MMAKSDKVLHITFFFFSPKGLGFMKLNLNNKEVSEQESR